MAITLRSKLEAIAEGAKIYQGKPCKRGHDGIRYVKSSSCAQCMSDHQKTGHAKAIKARHYQENKSAYIDKAQCRYAENRDKLIAYSCQKQKQNLKKIVEQRKARIQVDSAYAIKERVRGLIKECLKRQGHNKTSRTADILGCSIHQFKTHIARQFARGMTWENRQMWEIDHITPMATAKTEQEAIALNHFTNLRPLWKEENRSKSAKVLFLI